MLKAILVASSATFYLIYVNDGFTRMREALSDWIGEGAKPSVRVRRAGLLHVHQAPLAPWHDHDLSESA